MGSKDHSFDVVSQVDIQEVTNALDQSRKEILQRFDFKDSKTQIDWDLNEKTYTIQTESEYRLKSVTDIIQTKFAKRGVSLKAMEPQTVEKAAGGTVRQAVKIRQGIPSDKAKEIVKFIKEAKIKVQPTIQEEKVRVASVDIDNLQEVMQILRKKEFDLDLQFINYR